MFRAILLKKTADAFSSSLRDLSDDGLAQQAGDGDVVVDVAHSTINYKDGLAIANRSPVVRKWPMVPGIDGAGTVAASSHPAFAAGEQVVLTGWGVGETHWGCLAGRARLKGDWRVQLPAALSTR